MGRRAALLGRAHRRALRAAHLRRPRRLRPRRRPPRVRRPHHPGPLPRRPRDRGASSPTCAACCRPTRDLAIEWRWGGPLERTQHGIPWVGVLGQAPQRPLRPGLLRQRRLGLQPHRPHPGLGRPGPRRTTTRSRRWSPSRRPTCRRSPSARPARAPCAAPSSAARCWRTRAQARSGLAGAAALPHHLDAEGRHAVAPGRDGLTPQRARSNGRRRLLTAGVRGTQSRRGGFHPTPEVGAMPRFDPLTPIHKALRALVYEVGGDLQTTDFADELRGRSARRRDLELALHLMQRSPHHEEVYFYPKLQPLEERLVASMLEQHGNVERLLDVADECTRDGCGLADAEARVKAGRRPQPPVQRAGRLLLRAPCPGGGQGAAGDLEALRRRPAHGHPGDDHRRRWTRTTCSSGSAGCSRASTGPSSSACCAAPRWGCRRRRSRRCVELGAATMEPAAWAGGARAGRAVGA